VVPNAGSIPRMMVSGGVFVILDPSCRGPRPRSIAAIDDPIRQ
jgi:hypothetical protein